MTYINTWFVMKCRPRFRSLGAVGSSYNLGSKCSETHRDHFEPRLYDDPTAPKDRKTAFNSRQIPIHIRTCPWHSTPAFQKCA